MQILFLPYLGSDNTVARTRSEILMLHLRLQYLVTLMITHTLPQIEALPHSTTENLLVGRRQILGNKYAVCLGVGFHGYILHVFLCVHLYVEVTGQC